MQINYLPMINTKKNTRNALCYNNLDVKCTTLVGHYNGCIKFELYAMNNDLMQDTNILSVHISKDILLYLYFYW